MTTVILIPTYNERENLPSIVKEILATVNDTHVMVLDDNSPDGTGRVADLLASEDERVKVVHREKKAGLAAAYLDGFKRALDAGYERIFEMDADFSHQPRYLPDLFRALDSADMVVGSRYIGGGGTENWGIVRRIISQGGSAYARMILGIPYRDCTAGFVGYRRHVLETLDLDGIRSEGYAFQIELKYRAHQLGFSIVEVPIVFYDRAVGTSKMSGSIVKEAIWRVLQIRLKKDR